MIFKILNYMVIFILRNYKYYMKNKNNSLRVYNVCMYYLKIIDSINTISYVNKKFIKSKINNILAFSLIELSIVLIIIGLLVAGVTGGASLIESARIQATINQFNNIKTSMLAFRAARDRLPGDINDNFCIGYSQYTARCGNVAWANTGDVCNACGYYGGEYKDKNVGTVAGPFVDLYLAGINDFKPNPDSPNLELLTLPSISYINDILPVSQIDKAQAKMFFITDDEGLYLVHQTSDKEESLSKATLDPKMLKRIDQKIDDGIHDSGFIRAGYDYDINIQNNDKYSTVKFYIRELSY